MREKAGSPAWMVAMTDDETTRLKAVAQQQEPIFILRVIRIDHLPFLAAEDADEPPNGVRLPARRRHDLGQRGPFGPLAP